MSLNLFFSCLGKTKKERTFLNSIFLFSAERKKERAFMNSVFLFSVKRKNKRAFLNFVFLFFRGKEKGNTPCGVDFSFPGRSKYDEIS